MAGYCTLMWLVGLMLAILTSTSGQNGGCVDKKDMCEEWASTGECEKNREWMAANCPRVCNACPDQGCINANGKDEECEGWAMGDECKNNKNWMEKNCARACGRCNINPTQPSITTEAPSQDSTQDPGQDPGQHPGQDPKQDAGQDPGKDARQDPGQDQQQVQDDNIEETAKKADDTDNNGSNTMVVSIAIGVITLVLLLVCHGLRR